MSRTEEMRRCLNRWRRSGQSLREFAEQEKISYSTLVYWKAKLKKTAPRKSSSTAELIPVEVVEDSPSDAVTPFEIRCGNGFSIRVDRGFSEPDLRRLLQVVASC